MGGGAIEHLQANQHFVQRDFVGAAHGVAANERWLVQLHRPVVVNAARRGVKIGVLADEDVPFFQPQPEERF